MEILVVEDEAGIADFLERGLEAEGFAVRTAGDGIEGERLALEAAFDLVVLDRMLPGRDGLEVLAAIRGAKPALPVILLTARDEVAERVEGLDSGATDYVTKPFSFDELLARVRAHLRQADAETTTTLEACGDPPRPALPRGDPWGPTVRLPEREADAARLSDAPPGPGLLAAGDPRRGLGLRPRPGHQLVQVYIGYLRRKLDAPGSPAPIETVRSAGYRLVEPVSGGWARLGLRGRLALSIGAIVLVAFAVVFVAVRAEMTNESR